MSRITYIEQPCKSVLNRVEGMPFNWSINPYTGCAHACTYCYARAFYTRADRGTAADFDQVVYVKQNAPDVLRRELARRSWRRELVVVGAATDPYQPAEARFRVTRGILEALLAARTPVSIITKGPLILRDLDLLTAIGQVAGIEVNVTIPTLDSQAWRRLEPGAPPPRARMEAVRRLNEAGIATGVFMAPIIPGVSDDEATIDNLMCAAAASGATYVMPIPLRLGAGVREWFLPYISRHYPHLTRQYAQLYQRVEAPTDYRSRVRGLTGRLLQRYGLAGMPPQIDREKARLAEPVAPVQLRLSI